jgi:hypothetical protein
MEIQVLANEEFIVQSQEIEYIIETSRSKWQPYIYIFFIILYNILKIQTVLELDFRAVKFLFFPRRDLNPHHWYTAAPFA